MVLRKIETDKAPEAIGPYSQAVSAGGFLFVSGQLPIDALRGKVVKDNIEEQSRMVFDNIYEILKAANLAFKDVVKVDVYLKDLKYFKEFNEIYSVYFSKGIKPARSVVQANLPLDVLVEVSCIAKSK